jgi:hypothetical protein
MIYIDDITITQNGIRNPDQLSKMVEFVRSGGFFNLEALQLHRPDARKIIQLPQFPDGKIYLHDGHHRTASIWLGGRNYLREDEYRLYNETYERYMELNPSEDWYTPFDPRTEVRLPDFFQFKNVARNSPNLIAFISNWSWQYKTERNCYHVKDIVDEFSKTNRVSNQSRTSCCT